MQKLEQYLHPTDQERLARASTFEELVVVAFEVIDRMPKPVGIVCGPITSGGLGTPEANVAEFGRRISLLQAQGFNIFDQMPFEPDMWRIKKTPYYDPTRDHLLETFYGTLFSSGRIDVFYFIPGWESSYGARWEHDYAKRLGKTIVYLK